ncbi:MAG: TolB-like translocation protein [Planctomycetota bacterium]|jgi:Tol biopolymer transport system component
MSLRGVACGGTGQRNLDKETIMRARAESVIMAASIFIAFCASAWAGWTEPMPMTELNSPYHDKAPFLSYDGKTLYFTRTDGPGWHFTRMFQAVRDELSGALVVSEIATMSSASHHVDYPWVSVDNLRMYYYIAWGSTRKLMFTERDSVDDPWLPGTGVTELNALGDVANPSLTPDELTIFFTGTDVSEGVGGYDLWMATRPDKESPFGDAINLTEINSPGWDFHPSICPDGLTLYFASVCDEKSRLFRATRTSVDAPFGAPEHLSFFDSEGVSLQYPFLGNDGTALYFVGWEDGDTTDIHISYVSDDSEAKTFDMD